MRIYVPALFHELMDPVPTPRSSYRVIEDPSLGQEENEVREAQAVDEAALDSLEILRETNDLSMNQCGRLVIAVDIEELPLAECDEPQQLIEAICPIAFQWDDVVAFLADELSSRPSVQSIISAQTQDECDVALSSLWDQPLSWYDVSERDVLAKIWGNE